ncbi:hypothetical protein Z945_2934 [Sulfitobacter noctilucae]|nr:hypothetical protein Z945_2934 [Sulfitobacter noctilucae]
MGPAFQELSSNDLTASSVFIPGSGLEKDRNKKGPAQCTGPSSLCGSFSSAPYP